MSSCTVTCPCQLQVFLWKTVGCWSPALFLTETAVTFTVSLYCHCFWQVQQSCLQSAYTNTVSDRQLTCLQTAYTTTVSDRDSHHVYSQPTLPLFLTGSCHVYRQPTLPLLLTDSHHVYSQPTLPLFLTGSCHVYRQPTLPLLLTETAIMFTVSLHYHCFWQAAVMFIDSLHYHCYWQAAIMFTDSLHYWCYCLQSAYTGSDRQPSCLQSAYTTTETDIMFTVSLHYRWQNDRDQKVRKTFNTGQRRTRHNKHWFLILNKEENSTTNADF